MLYKCYFHGLWLCEADIKWSQSRLKPQPHFSHPLLRNASSVSVSTVVLSSCTPWIIPLKELILPKAKGCERLYQTASVILDIPAFVLWPFLLLSLFHHCVFKRLLLTQAFMRSFAHKWWSQPGLWSFIGAFRNPQGPAVVISALWNVQAFTPGLGSAVYLSASKSRPPFTDNQVLQTFQHGAVGRWCRTKTGSTRLLRKCFCFLPILVLLPNAARCFRSWGFAAGSKCYYPDSMVGKQRQSDLVKVMQPVGDWAETKTHLSCASHAKAEWVLCPPAGSTVMVAGQQ